MTTQNDLPKFARENDLTLAQYDILNMVQRIAFDNPDNLDIFTPEIADMAKRANLYLIHERDRLAFELDVQIAQEIKRVWPNADKYDIIALSQIENSRQ